MSSPSDTLGAATEPSQEELDLMERSTKKQKGEGTFLPQRSLRSYKDSLVSPSNNWENHADFNMDNPFEEEDSDGECDIDEKYPTISLSKEEKMRIQAPWRSALIIKAFGKSIGFKYMEYKIKVLWNPIGELQCIDLGLDYFLIRFKLSEDYWKVVNGGPWFVKQQFLSIRRWSPGFRPSEAKMTTTAVWVRLPELPIELYDARLLTRIGNQLGTLLKIDTHTMDNQRGRFARLCIQVDIDQPLTPKIRIGNKLQRIQYEGISSICFECGCVGHKASTCPTIIVPNIPTPITPENKSETEKDYGDWMLVTRKKFSKLKVQTNARSSNHRGAHRNQTTSTTTPGEAPAGRPFQNSKEQIHLDSHKDPPTATGPTNLHITTETYQPVDSCPMQRQSPSKHSDNPKEVIKKHPEKNLDPVNLAHPSQNGTVPSRQKNVNLVSQPTVLEESTACNSSTRKTNTPHITQQTMCGPTVQPCMQPTDSPMDLDQKNHQTSTSLASNHLQPIQTYNPYTHTQVNHSSSSHHGSTDSSISSPLLQEKSQDPTTTSSPKPNQHHATTPSRPHTLPKHLGNTHARETSPNRGQPGQLASPLPKPILDSSGRCHGESIEVPCTSVSPKHQLWPCGGEPHNRPCICLTNDGTHGRHSTPLESTESNHPNPSSDTRDPNWDRDHLRAERCRSPRKSDLHHLPRELPDIPSLSCQRSNHYSDRSTSTSFILPPVSGSHPQCLTTTPFIQGGTQPTTKELAGELSQPSPPEFSTAREEPGAGPSARNPQHIINEDPAMEL
jgi:hypothetical protein